MFRFFSPHPAVGWPDIHWPFVPEYSCIPRRSGLVMRLFSSAALSRLGLTFPAMIFSESHRVASDLSSRLLFGTESLTVWVCSDRSSFKPPEVSSFLGVFYFRYSFLPGPSAHHCRARHDYNNLWGVSMSATTTSSPLPLARAVACSPLAVPLGTSRRAPLPCGPTPAPLPRQSRTRWSAGPLGLRIST